MIQSIEELIKIVSEDPYNNNCAIKLYWYLYGNFKDLKDVEDKFNKTGWGHDDYCREISKARAYLNIHDPMLELAKEYPDDFKFLLKH